MKWNECLKLFRLLYLVERCSAIVTWWKPCFSQLNLETCIVPNCQCSWIQRPVLDNQQQNTTYIEALQNFRYTNALLFKQSPSSEHWWTELNVGNCWSGAQVFGAEEGDSVYGYLVFRNWTFSYCFSVPKMYGLRRMAKSIAWAILLRSNWKSESDWSTEPSIFRKAWQQWLATRRRPPRPHPTPEHVMARSRSRQSARAPAGWCRRACYSKFTTGRATTALRAPLGRRRRRRCRSGRPSAGSRAPAGPQL